MAFSYSITLSSFLRLKEDFESTLHNLSQLGLENTEMFGEPDDINRAFFKDIFSSCNLHVTGITGMWGKSSPNGWKRRLLSNDQGMVKYSKEYIKKCIYLCNYFGGNKINICLLSDPINYLDVTHNSILTDEKTRLLKKSIPILNSLSSIAKDHEVNSAIEPLNRYSTPYCCNYSDTTILLENCPNLQVMLDTFHMNIEEDSLGDVIISANNRLANMHFADNNRKMPGQGHIDFEPIIRSLKKISYEGYISFEPTILNTDYKTYIKGGLEFIKNLELER
jgi:sugar phosphate isomerase/epimerase